MTRYLLLFLLMGFSLMASAQSDSTAYQLQRNKVNALLAQRSSRFGQYQQSLNARTGIFGMQTKKDIKNSNDILRQITLHDNKIFRELKVLMEYKEMQVQQVQTTALENSEKVEQFTQVVKKLQQRNRDMALQVKNAENQRTIAYYLAAAVFIIMLIIIIVLGSKLRNAGNIRRFS